jgi:ketosteroid isomerase-like protein
MSQENVELMQRSLQHFAETGEPLTATLAADVEVYDHDIPDAGVYRGPEGFTRWVADWSEAWGNFSMTPERWIDAGDKVVMILTMTCTGKGSGLQIERRDGMVWTIVGGMVVRVDYYNNEEQALEAAGVEQ